MTDLKSLEKAIYGSYNSQSYMWYCTEILNQ